MIEEKMYPTQHILSYGGEVLSAEIFDNESILLESLKM